VHFHLGHLVDPQHVVVIEVALLHAAATDRDPAAADNPNTMPL